MVESLLSVAAPAPRLEPVARPQGPVLDASFQRPFLRGLENQREIDVSNFRRERFITDEIRATDRFAPPPNGSARDFFARPLTADFVPGPREAEPFDVNVRPFDRRTLPPAARNPEDGAASVVDPSFFARFPLDVRPFVEAGPSAASIEADTRDAQDRTQVVVDFARLAAGAGDDALVALAGPSGGGSIVDPVRAIVNPSGPAATSARFEGFIDFQDILRTRSSATAEIQQFQGVPDQRIGFVGPSTAAIDQTGRRDLTEFNIDSLTAARSTDPQRVVEVDIAQRRNLATNPGPFIPELRTG